MLKSIRGIVVTDAEDRVVGIFATRDAARAAILAVSS
jgi:hypothetical protein